MYTYPPMCNRFGNGRIEMNPPASEFRVPPIPTANCITVLNVTFGVLGSSAARENYYAALAVVDELTARPRLLPTVISLTASHPEFRSALPLWFRCDRRILSFF